MIIKDFFKKKKIIFFTFFVFLIFQLIYSFLFPAVGFTGTGHGWLSLQDLVNHQRSPLGVGDTSIIDKITPFFSKYNINADGGEYIVLAKNFPQYFFQNQIYLSRPLYSLLIATVAFLPHLFFNFYIIYFGSAIFLNFVLALGAAIMLYLILERLISSRVAFLSSLLYIFSPLVHVGMIQPVAEVYGSFQVVTGLYLLYNYIKNPSRLKLLIFSLIVGLLLLGRMFPVTIIFVLMLAVYFKRYKEGFLFLLFSLIPFSFWYLLVTQVFHLRFYENAVENFGSVTWMLSLFSSSGYVILQTFIGVLPKFIKAIIEGFLLIPLIFAFLGFKSFILKNKNFIYFSFIFSFLTVFFIANFYFSYHGLLMFPLVYPLTVLGIDRVADSLKKRKPCSAKIFYLMAFMSIIIISSINIYKIVKY